MTAKAKTVTLEYVGPEGQESPTIGPLVAGQRYQVEAVLAAYLCETHPAFWREPVKAAPPKE